MGTSKIADIRQSAGVDQRELANELGLPQQRLSDIERGYTSTAEDIENQVRKALGCILRKRLALVRER